MIYGILLESGAHPRLQAGGRTIIRGAALLCGLIEVAAPGGDQSPVEGDHGIVGDELGRRLIIQPRLGQIVEASARASSSRAQIPETVIAAASLALASEICWAAEPVEIR